MYKLMKNVLPAAMNRLVIRNNDIHQFNTQQKYQLYGVRPMCQLTINSS